MRICCAALIVVILTSLSSSAARAQADADSKPAPSNVGAAEYPRIRVDRRVTFRIKAPSATSVKLAGGAGLVKQPLEMVRGEDGTWSVTTPPSTPGFHYYWFDVDGLRVNDPASYAWFGYGRETSGIEIPDAGVDFYDAKPDVPHGEVRARHYFSKVTGKWRRANVYTPAEYDASQETRYPVLYLLHGAGENERGWVEQGRANFILDNLIAAGKTRPMILVVDTGYAAYAAGTATGPTKSGPTAAFQSVLLTDLIPTIDTHYRTLADPGHRALAGLSMGSGQALEIALHNLDTFAWIGAMSGPPRSFDAASSYDGVFRDAGAFHKQAKILWIGAGTDEERIHTSAAVLHDALTKAGIKSVFYSSPGTDHEWQTWRRSLHDFAPRLFGD